MRSKTSFFNATLFRKTVRRFWPLWCAYALCWLAAMPLTLGGSLSNYLTLGEDYTQRITYLLRAQPLQNAGVIAVVFTLVMGCVAAMAVYSYLYSHRNVSAYALLPVRRECVFTTVTLAGLLPVLVIHVLVFLVTLLTEVALGAVYVPALFTWLAAVTLMYLFFFGFAAFCAQLTGNLVALPLLYVVLNFTAFVVVYIVSNLLNAFVFGYSGSTPQALDYLSPAAAMLAHCGIQTVYIADSLGGTGVMESGSYVYNGMGLLIAFAVLGVAFTVAALLSNRRRRMESAGDVVAVGWLRPVFKYCMALGCALCIGTLLYSLIYSGNMTGVTGAAALSLCMLVGCFIGYFVAQMLTGKTFSVFRGGRNWLGFAIACALSVGFVFSCEFDLWGYERSLPDESRVTSVTISTNGDSVTLTEREHIIEAIRIHGEIVDNKDYHETKDGQYSSWLSLTYQYADGETFVRSYPVQSDGTGELLELQSLINTDEAVASRKATPVDITSENIYYAYLDYTVLVEDGVETKTMELTAQEAAQLYHDCILPDIAQGGLGRIWLITDDSYYNDVYNASIQINYYEPGPENHQSERASYYFTTTPTVKSTRTNEWLLAHGVELYPIKDFYQGVEGAVPATEAVHGK